MKAALSTQVNGAHSQRNEGTAILPSGGGLYKELCARFLHDDGAFLNALCLSLVDGELSFFLARGINEHEDLLKRVISSVFHVCLVSALPEP